LQREILCLKISRPRPHRAAKFNINELDGQRA
jgi:hypothetical protein